MCALSVTNARIAGHCHKRASRIRRFHRLEPNHRLRRTRFIWRVSTHNRAARFQYGICIQRDVWYKAKTATVNVTCGAYGPLHFLKPVPAFAGPSMFACAAVQNRRIICDITSERFSFFSRPVTYLVVILLLVGYVEANTRASDAPNLATLRSLQKVQ